MNPRSYPIRSRNWDQPSQFSTQTILLATLFFAALITFFQDSAGSRNYFGVFSPYVSTLLATIYFWKWLILRSGWCRSDRRRAYWILLACLLPFVYWRCLLIPTYHSLFTHLILSPIWVYAIPTISFFWLDQCGKTPNSETYFGRSLIEIFAVLPIWSVLFTLFCLAIGAADTFYSRGC